MSVEAHGQKIDQLFAALGVWGGYQVLQMSLVKFLSFPASFQLYIYLYLGYQPPLRCQSVVNITSQAHMYVTPNMSVDTGYHKTCVGLIDLINDTLVETERCDSGYDYAQPKDSTLITEWDLVCDQSYQAQLSQTVLVVGQGVGATFFTSLADRFGRKKICLISQWIMLLVSVGTAFAPSILVFTLIRFFLGAAQQGHVMSMFVMPIEVLPRPHRATIQMIGSFLWSAFLFVLIGLAYGFQDYNWRYFQLTTVVATLATLLPNMLFLDESLRWLLSNGRTEEARRIIDKAAKMNGINPDDISIALHASQNNIDKDTDKDTDKKERKSNLLDIFRHRKLRKTAFIMCFAWIVNAGTSFGLSLTAAKLSGDRFLNYFLIFVCDIPATIISYITMQRIGRRATCIASHFITGSTLLAAVVINTYLGPSGWVTGLTVVGKFGITMSWGTLFQYTPELYPTNLRSVGLGIASSSSRIGGMLAPFATIVIDYHPWLPGTIYGSSCLAIVFFLFLLTETVDKELPQTIEEINSWKKKKKKKKREEKESEDNKY
ncbi:organic anion transporter 3-like [Liolophura sinensis]|uniref:organic anion transporter 3-like n=1 Tax=Liolophura sinensis TaxID=3198878 RepID=UPI00315898ED